MREISPAVGMSVDDWLRAVPELKPFITKIRQQKVTGGRLKPSRTLIDRSKLLTSSHRKMLLDKIAELVDENYCGRSEMCQQFAMLLHKALTHLRISSRLALGTATYFDKQGRKLFSWEHVWVCVEEEVIDGNIDSLGENPLISKEVCVCPYWGAMNEMPRDRQLCENHSAQTMPPDDDVEHIWWPELQVWLNNLDLNP